MKIRLFIVLAVSMGLFTTLGWFFARPLDPDGALTLVQHHQPVLTMILLVLLAIVVTIVGLMVGGRHAGQIAPMALPLGLSCWVIQTSGFESLLIKCSDVASLSHLFQNMIFDTMLWCIPVALALGVVIYGGRYLTRLTGIETNGENKPARHDVTTSSESLLSSEGFMAKQGLRNVLALLLTCAIAMILLKLILQTGKTRLLVGQNHVLGATPASMGQIIFSLLVAFGVGAGVAHQLLGTPLWCFLAAPPLVALFNYISAMTTANFEIMEKMASSFFPAQMTTAMVLPLQFIAIGTLAVMWGHWFSLLVHHEKKLQAETARNEDGGSVKG
ncbi:MAG: hypothetical protein K9M57_04950 [Phycisphaerae bacterium]|nr:hypothetical protein [Phycisphaerae bacterium]